MHRRQFVSLAALAAPAFVRQALAQEAGLTAKTLTIGCSAATTGPLASSGLDIQRGTEAAMAQINARGGIHGRALQLLMMDDAYEPERTASNVKQMLSQGRVFALLSCFGTPNNQAILPMVVESGVPYVAPLSGASSLRKNVRNIFHVRASYTDEVQRLVQQLQTGRLAPTRATHTAHVQQLKERHNPQAERKCPQCGSAMALRTAKSGANAGKQFWGCSTFPRCRVIQKL